MWGFLAGLYLALAVYPYVEEWLARRADKMRLADLRSNFRAGRRWDAVKGQWENREKGAMTPRERKDMKWIVAAAAIAAASLFVAGTVIGWH